MVSVIRCSPSRSGSSFPFGVAASCCCLDLGRLRRLEQRAGVAGAVALVARVHAGRRERHHQGGRGDREQDPRNLAVHPGGQVIGRPASRCRWVWKTLCPAPAPVLKTSR